MSYVQNRELDGKPNQGEWLHDDGSARCVISTGGVKSRVAGPVMISNDTKPRSSYRSLLRRLPSESFLIAKARKPAGALKFLESSSIVICSRSVKT